MKTYDIPCQCGNRIPVTVNQAGTSVTCPCGREVAVPSLRQLTQMAGPSEEDAKAEPTMSPLGGWIRLLQWVGGSLVVLALIGFVVLYAQRPRLPNLRTLPPAVAYHYFKALRTGEPSPLLAMEANYIRYHGVWIGLRDIVIIVGIIGGVLFLGVTLAGWWETRSSQGREEESSEDNPDEADFPVPG